MAALVIGFGAFGLMFGVWQVALPDLTIALAIDEAALGPDHPTVVGIRANRARVMDGSEHPRAEPRG